MLSKRVVAGVGFLEVAGEKVYGGLDVALAHHLVRMDVAAGDRDRDRGIPPCRRWTPAASVPQGKYLPLVRDIPRARLSSGVLEEPGV